MTKVLFVISAADRWTLDDGTVHSSCYWAEEVAVPHQIFSNAGMDITIATPSGKAPTLDQRSLGISGGMPWKRRKVKQYLDTEAGVEYSKALIPLRPHVVVDRNLYSGQNPQSSEKLAKRLVADVVSAH